MCVCFTFYLVCFCDRGIRDSQLFRDIVVTMISSFAVCPPRSEVRPIKRKRHRGLFKLLSLLLYHVVSMYVCSHHQLYYPIQIDSFVGCLFSSFCSLVCVGCTLSLHVFSSVFICFNGLFSVVRDSYLTVRFPYFHCVFVSRYMRALFCRLMITTTVLCR